MRRHLLLLLNDGLILVILIVAILGSGCRGPAVMRSSFSEYSEAYASTVNEQMLLNLARRANGHPAYFLQMGLINSSFAFSAAAGGNVSGARGRNQIGHGIITELLTAGGNLNFSGTEQPTFAITPLAGGTFAQAIFAPIRPIIFFSLLEQGRPVDQLMRIMVHSVELTYGETNRLGKTFAIRNVVDLERQENFRNFLRLSGLYRELQKVELLTIRSDGDGFGLTFRPGAAMKMAQLGKLPEYQLEPESEWAVEYPEQVPTNAVPGVVLRFRTFEGVLTALATEYQVYDLAIRDQAAIPASQQVPILRIDDQAGTDSSTLLTSVNYRGKRYQIADSSRAKTWNRDVFNLLSHLFTQISVDPDKLPVQQLIQIH